MSDLLFDVAMRGAASLTVAAVLSIVIEKALSVVFNYRLYVDKLGGKGFKVPIAIAVSYLALVPGQTDILAAITDTEVSTLGLAISALLVAGGAKKFGELFGDLKQAAGGRTIATKPKRK